MSPKAQRARVVALDDTAAVTAALDGLLAAIKAGRVTAVALVAAGPDGALEPWWGAARPVGPQAGSILRGAVAYLAAVMDAEALDGG